MDEELRAALLAVQDRGIEVFWRYLSPSAIYADTREDATKDFRIIEATFHDEDVGFWDGYRTLLFTKHQSPYVIVVSDANEEWGVTNHYELTEEAINMLDSAGQG